MTDVVAYRRVSTHEQADSGAGMSAQRAAIERAARERGWRIIGWHDDVVTGSGKRPLPGRDAAVQQCEASKTALVCAKLDRLGRSALDVHRIDEHARQHGFSLVLLDLGIDTGTPMGRAMMGMAAVFAQLERDMISQRTREGLAAKRAAGVRIGRPASVPGDVARLAREFAEAEWTVRQIADFLNAACVPTPRGGACWRPSSLTAVLQ
jgi:DNA invertase Pin-like site-specific DNA recombinase